MISLCWKQVYTFHSLLIVSFLLRHRTLGFYDAGSLFVVTALDFCKRVRKTVDQIVTELDHLLAFALDV